MCVCVCVYLTRMGCGALDYRQQAQQKELRTGGMSVSTQVISDSHQMDTFEQVSVSAAAARFMFTSSVLSLQTLWCSLLFVSL